MSEGATPGAAGGGALGRWVRRVARRSPILLALAALVHPLARLAARWDWRLDLLTHFQEPALAATILAAAAMLAAKRPRPAVALLALAAFQAPPVFRFLLPNPVPAASSQSPRLRILMANVLVDNHDYAALADLIHETRPDVVGLVEVSPEWVRGLADVARMYPYRVEIPFGAAGLALWFKQEPERLDPPRLPCPDGWPYLRASFRFAGQTRHLWLIHPASPLRRRGEHPGFPELEGLGPLIRDDGGSTIVMGDFNSTDGSPYFREFLATTGLRDSRLGFGRQGSWPAWSPYKIAIDHALVSPDLAVVARRLGPSIGSDHFPLIVDLAPSAAAARTTAAQPSAAAR